MFTSGIGVHYGPSSIVNPAHQALASNLIVGQRVLPHVFVRCADARPVELQDALPADTRFKLLVFLGAADARTLAEKLERADGWFRRFGGADPWRVFDVLTICAGSKHEVSYTDFPKALCSHWSK